MKPGLILVIEDDASILFGLRDNLQRAGYEVRSAGDGQQGLELARTLRPDLVLLDLLLPGLSGHEVCRRIRADGLEMPVVMLTALGEEPQVVRGLNLGADDYVTKPFDFPELLARLQALLRRSQRRQGSTSQLGRLALDEAARRAWVAGEPIELSGREWTLLSLLVQQQGKVVTKEQIHSAWSDESEVGGGNAIEVYVHRLRRKTEGAGVNIRTVRGIGYLLEAEAGS